MIADIGKYYLYRHIRLDKNEPFYIGIGTKSEKGLIKNSAIYRRAYDSEKCRNKVWKDIVRKTQYEVEILIESNDYDFILNKEIEFIKIYGRINNGTGVLSNLTDGGEGTLGTIYSKERNDSISAKNKGRIKTESERVKIAVNLIEKSLMLQVNLKR